MIIKVSKPTPTTSTEAPKHPPCRICGSTDVEFGLLIQPGGDRATTISCAHCHELIKTIKGDRVSANWIAKENKRRIAEAKKMKELRAPEEAK